MGVLKDHNDWQHTFSYWIKNSQYQFQDPQNLKWIIEAFNTSLENQPGMQSLRHIDDTLWKMFAEIINHMSQTQMSRLTHQDDDVLYYQQYQHQIILTVGDFKKLYQQFWFDAVLVIVGLKIHQILSCSVQSISPGDNETFWHMSQLLNQYLDRQVVHNDSGLQYAINKLLNHPYWMKTHILNHPNRQDSKSNELMDHLEQVLLHMLTTILQNRTMMTICDQSQCNQMQDKAA